MHIRIGYTNLFSIQVWKMVLKVKKKLSSPSHYYSELTLPLHLTAINVQPLLLLLRHFSRKFVQYRSVLRDQPIVAFCVLLPRACEEMTKSYL